MSINLKSLSEHIKEDIFLSREDVEAIISIFPMSIKSDACEFLLLKCTKDKIREDDFIEFLLDGIVRYALTTKEYRSRGDTPKEKERWWQKNAIKIARQAKHQFANSQYMGELGELFLFMLLESKGIVQLLNKMSLKTSPEMPVHGLDGIHLEVDEEKVVLHYGYSKIYGGFAKALDDLLDEVNEFHSNKTRRRHEINLVSSKIDELKFESHHEEIVKLLSPYHENKDYFSETNSLFLGYQWAMLNRSPRSGLPLSDYQVEAYKKRFESLIKQFVKKKQQRASLNDQNLNLYIMPFKDVDSIRELFRKEIKE